MQRVDGWLWIKIGMRREGEGTGGERRLDEYHARGWVIGVRSTSFSHGGNLDPASPKPLLRHLRHLRHLFPMHAFHLLTIH